MTDEEDFLAELIAERTKKNPNFPAMVEAALQRRKAARTRGANQSARIPDKTPEMPNDGEVEAPPIAVSPSDS